MTKQSDVRIISNKSLESGYEVSDISRKTIAIGTFALMILTAIMIIGLILIFFWWKGWIQSFYHQKYFLTAPEQTPQQPRLQDNPYGEYQNWRREQEKLLHSQGWVNREEGTISISIDEAMDQLIQENLEQK